MTSKQWVLLLVLLLLLLWLKRPGKSSVSMSADGNPIMQRCFVDNGYNDVPVSSGPCPPGGHSDIWPSDPPLRNDFSAMYEEFTDPFGSEFGSLIDPLGQRRLV